MKRTAIVLFLLLILSITYAQNDNTQGRTIPSVTIKDFKGNPYNTSEIKNDGKPLILSFWATWCKPCLRELNAIADVYDDWVNETGVKLVAVSIDDARSTKMVEPLVNGKAWEYIVLLDPNGDFKRAMNVGPIPQTFLLNGKGEIVWQHTTFAEGDELTLIEIVKKVIKGEPLN